MNHAPLIPSKRAMLFMAIAASCPFVQAATDGYLSTTTAAGTSEVGPAAVYASQSGVQTGINAREVARRQAMKSEAMQLLQEGRNAYTAGKYKEALEKYQAAWARIPKAPATRKQQEFIVQSIGDASIAVAIEYSKIGRYDDAEQLLLEVIARDPSNKRARKELSLLRDPIRNNPALTPEHVKNVEEVNRLLTLAYGYYDLGKYNEAYAEFNRVLQIDPYNEAARRGQEAVSVRRQHYYQAAHSSFRAKALAEVDALWEEPLPQELPDIEIRGDESVTVSESQIRNNENLDKIQITAVNFEDTPMEDALDFLRGEARKAGVQINFIFERAKSVAPAPVVSDYEDEEEEEEEEDAGPVAVVQAPTEAIISRLVVEGVTAKELLQMMCDQSSCQYRVEDKAIVVSQTGTGSEKMFRRQWKVSRNFFTGSGDEEDSSDDDSAFADDSGSSASRRIDAMAALKASGVAFPKGATANYSAKTGMLTVNNTPDNLDAVEDAIQEYRRQLPPMIKVSAKFVEVSQTNEEELSFDWVFNPFSVNNSGSMYLGGVNGNSSMPNRTYNDFVTSGGSAFANNFKGSGSWPVVNNSMLADATDTVTQGLVTSGLRSGTGALKGNTLTNLVNSGSAAASSNMKAAPGILALSGIYDSGSFQGIMRGLSQKKGVDIMSAPSLVAGVGPMPFTPEVDPMATDQTGDDDCAKIEVIRRFIYPIAYEAPDIQSGGNNNWGNNGNNDNDNWNGGGGMPVASPANPTDWGVEEVGIVMRFRVSEEAENDDIIKFEHFEIKVVDFEGFINYGSPITAGITTANQIEHITLTENRIDMPIFSRRYINSNPSIYDGHTIAIGGMIEDNVQKVEDKVPVFGDLPLIGRFFRSDAESHVRKNLMVFVTAEKIDPTGKPWRHRDTSTGGDSSAASTAPGLFPDDGLANP